MSQYYVAFDTETGGRDHKTSDVLTIYLGIFDESFILRDELDLKLKPNDGRLPVCEAEALNVNGIDVAKHLADPETITYAEAKEKIIPFLKKYLQKRGRYSNLIPLGHNLPFDLGYVWEYLIPKSEWEKIVHYRIADTMPIVNFLKDCGWFPKEIGNLSSVVDFLGVKKRDAHNAREDVLMCVDCYKVMLELAASRKNGNSTSQHQDLIALLEAE